MLVINILPMEILLFTKYLKFMIDCIILQKLNLCLLLEYGTDCCNLGSFELNMPLLQCARDDSILPPTFLIETTTFPAFE